jgi:membrane-bound serine protease (ClpP class)
MRPSFSQELMVRGSLWNILARSDVDILYSLLIHLSIDCGVLSRMLNSWSMLSSPGRLLSAPTINIGAVARPLNKPRFRAKRFRYTGKYASFGVQSSQQSMKWRIPLSLILLTLLPLLCAAQGRTVTLLTLDGPIDPISARYVQRGLDQAARDGAVLAVLEMDTPGGLSVSMDQIVAKILASPVPVAVYVWPQGARAASAGVFIAMAAQIAVMAPGTHIGAAHPVTSGGGDIQGTMGVKVLNDTLAKLKSLAQLRHRNVAWADQAVRRSISLTESEAVARGVVDFSAADLGDLLQKVDGRTVDTPHGATVLHTTGAVVRPFTMSFIDRFLGFLVNPDIAYILLIIGMFGVIFELSHPGLVAPGIAGAVALLLSFISFGSLPTNLGGILFIVLAIVLFILDIKLPTHGVLTAGGIASFVLGSFLLFPPWRVPRVPQLPSVPAVPRVAIDPAIIILMTVLVSSFFIFVVSKGLLAQRRKPSFGTESLPGARGVATTEIAPEGQVHSMGEQWSARSVEGPIHIGENVEVVGREGLCLLVRRSPPGQGGAS